jgi:hypothetical protein
MSDHGCVITSPDLLEKILSSNQKSGWFKGFRLTSEKIYLAIQCVLDGEVISSGSSRLLPHRAASFLLGTLEEELLQWIVVSAGFQKELGNSKVLSEPEYMTLLGFNDPEGRPLAFVAIEPSDQGPTVTAGITIRLEDGRRLIIAIDSIVQPAKASPFASGPKRNNRRTKRKDGSNRRGRKRRK